MKRFKKVTFFVPKIVILFSLISFNIGLEEQIQKCHEGLSVELTFNSVNADGTIVANGLTFKKGTYWKDNTTNTYFGCPCHVTRCLRRCPDEYYKNENSSDSSLEFTSFTIWHNNQPQEVNAHEHFHVFTGQTCPKERAIVLEPVEVPEDEYQILRNGTIFFPNLNDTAEANKYCVYRNEKNNEIEVIVCIEEHEAMQPPKTAQHYIYPIFMLISVLFLIATLVAYAVAPEMRKVHGQSIACHSGSLMLGFLGLATVQIVGQEISDVACSTIAFITYYFLLASFFWLHVMCFDIWWTFSGFKKMTGSLRQTSKKKFIMYSIYAWTMPTVLFTITILLEFVSNIDEDLKPGFGKMRCWFQTKTPEFIYFNGPISIILGMNLFFFISTTIKIIRLKRESAMLKRGDSRMHNNEESEDKQRFKLYMKLFLVMGLSWIMEILSALIGGPEQIWYLTDIINTLQGVLIFIFCVWTTKVKESVMRRLFPRFSHALSTQPTKSNTKSSDVLSESITAPTAISMKKLQNSQDAD